MQENNDDKLLVHQLISHNEMAFQKLYVKYRGDIYAYSRSLLKSNSNAEEIVQDTFLKVWLNCENLNPDLSFKAYLFTIARNLSFNFLSKAANIQSLREEIFYKSQGAYYNINDSLADDDYELVRQKAIGSLPPKRKVIFQKSRDEGKSYEDISKEMGISVSTVKTQMSKALENIRHYLHANTDLTFSMLLLFSNWFNNNQ